MKRIIVLVCVLCLLGMESILWAGELTVRFLDVGQGDATLIETSRGNVVLIDSGPGEQTIMDHLERWEISHIDLLIASHPHADHITGMERIIEQYLPRTFMDPGLPHTTRTYERLVEAIKKHGIRYYRASARRITLGSLILTVLPPVNPPIRTSELNNNSAVIRLDYGNLSLLFTGDIEAEREKQLLEEAEESLDVVVLKIPHHGSRSSSTPAFLQAVNPDISIIFCGLGNRYEHPHQETLDELLSRGIRVFRTDRDGTIMLSSDGTVYSVTTEASLTRQAQGRDRNQAIQRDCRTARF